MVSLNGVQIKDAGVSDTALTGAELVPFQEPAGGSSSTKHTTTQAIADLGGGGGGAVDSVDGQTGVVVLSAIYQPLDSDLTAIAALSTTAFGRSLLALVDAAALRTAAGLGTAATTAATDYQPIDSDLTAIAALATTSYGRAFLALADAAAARTAIGLAASTVPFTPNGSIAATDVQAAIQEVRDEASSGSLTDAVVLAPNSSARNVIEGDGDVTELTLKADTGQTAPIHEIQDEDGNTLYSFDPNGLVEVSPNALGDGVTTPRYRIVTAELGDDGIDVFQVYSLDLATVLFNLDSSGGVEADLRSDDASWFISSTGRSNTTPGVRFQVPIKVSGFGGGILFDVDLDGFHVIHAEVVGPNIYDHGIDVDGTTGLVSLLGVSRVAATVGQTDPILDFQDENEATVAQVHIGGAIGTRGTEPADGDIAAGECFRWFDATNGAACVKFKGKQANGTVVTCTIPMT